MISEWFYDKNDDPKIYLEEDKLFSANDKEIGTLIGKEVRNIDDEIVGNYEQGVIYDMDDRPIAFTEYARGYIPSLPDILGGNESPDMASETGTTTYSDESEVTDFSGIPGGPGESGSPLHPVHNSWSDMTLDDLFGMKL